MITGSLVWTHSDSNPLGFHMVPLYKWFLYIPLSKYVVYIPLSKYVLKVLCGIVCHNELGRNQFLIQHKLVTEHAILYNVYSYNLEYTIMHIVNPILYHNNNKCQIHMNSSYTLVALFSISVRVSSICVRWEKLPSHYWCNLIDCSINMRWIRLLSIWFQRCDMTFFERQELNPTQLSNNWTYNWNIIYHVR